MIVVKPLYTKQLLLHDNYRKFRLKKYCQLNSINVTHLLNNNTKTWPMNL